MKQSAWLNRAPVLTEGTAACIVCDMGLASAYNLVDGVQFFKCNACGSLFAAPEFISRIDRGDVVNYQSAYWASELQSAHERSFGSSLLRIAETLRMSRIPISRFVDIGTGSGALLDAVDALLPELSSRFYGIELYPPAPNLRSQHPNYQVGELASVTEVFDAGVCIEVIEHMSPPAVRALGYQLARCSRPGSLYFFNSAPAELCEHARSGLPRSAWQRSHRLVFGGWSGPSAPAKRVRGDRVTRAGLGVFRRICGHDNHKPTTQWS